MQFANTKYAFIFKLDQSLKKDKLDQVLLFDHSPADFLSSQLIEKDEQGKNSFRYRSLETKKNNYTCWLLDWFLASPYKQHLVVILSDKNKLESEIYQELGVSENHHLLGQLMLIFEKNNQKTKEQSFSLLHSIKSIAHKFTNQKSEIKDVDDEPPKIEYKPDETQADFQSNQSKKSDKSPQWLENRMDWIAKFLNSTKLLTQKDFVNLNENDSIRIENGKIVLLQKEFSQSFEKYLLLTSLSFAYAQSLKKATLCLAQQKELRLSDLKNLQVDCKDALEFIKSYYFYDPLTSHSPNLHFVWEKLSNHARLPNLYDEFIAKFHLIFESINFQKTLRKIQNAPEKEIQNEIERELKIKRLSQLNRNLIIFGLIFIFIALLSITPFSINYFLQNWLDVTLPFLARFG